MFSKIAKVGASFAAAALGTLAVVGDAGAQGAGTLNTHGAAFVAFNAGQSNLVDYVTSGVRTGNAGGLTVIGSVVRSPAGGAQNFYIDGSNSPGKSTSFTLYSHDYQGVLQSSVSFSSSSATYDILQGLTPISNFSYVSLLAVLPGSYGGVLRGIAAIQP